MERNPTEIFAPQEALEQMEGDTALLADIIDLFLGEMPKLLQTMQQALERSDMEAMRIAAHTLKGSASSICAGAVVRVASDLEKKAKDNDSVGVSRELSTLERESEILVAVLADYRR